MNLPALEVTVTFEVTVTWIDTPPLPNPLIPTTLPAVNEIKTPSITGLQDIRHQN
jgi:hypothetical protein